jgi:hypothetical protein
MTDKEIDDLIDQTTRALLGQTHKLVDYDVSQMDQWDTIHTYSSFRGRVLRWARATKTQGRYLANQEAQNEANATLKQHIISATTSACNIALAQLHGFHSVYGYYHGIEVSPDDNVTIHVYIDGERY